MVAQAVEGAVLFALNQGEVCTCQSRLLVQEDIYDKFMEKVVARTEAIKLGEALGCPRQRGGSRAVVLLHTTNLGNTICIM